MATAATTTVSDGRHPYRPQAIGRVFGWFFLAMILTFVRHTSSATTRC
jgi:hypothetical protein